jgi:hypothetical protein
MSFLTKTLMDGHRMFICIPRIFCSIFLIFFKMHLKCIFIIGVFGPMSQNTMSCLYFSTVVIILLLLLL